MKIEPFKVVRIGEGYAVYDEHERLVVYSRDRAVAEAESVKLPEMAPNLSKDEPNEEDMPAETEVGETPVTLEDRIGTMSFTALRAMAKEQSIPAFHQMGVMALRAALLRRLARE